MRLVTFVPPDGEARAGALLGPAVVDLAAAAPLVIEESEGLRWDLLSLLQGDQEGVNLETAATLMALVPQLLGGTSIWEDDLSAEPALEDLAGSLAIGGATMLYPLDQVRLLAPLPRPTSLRLYLSFEEHALAVASLRGGSLHPAWYRGPAFSFANHMAIYGPGAPLALPQTDELDYGLGLGCVLGRCARDLTPAEAPAVIAGYLILNSWSARDVEAQERPLGLGPGKARDFATSLGPWLVTPDELELYADDAGRMSLLLQARVNGILRSQATAATQFYPFAELIAHASRDVTLYPGEVIGSGPVGGGSLLEQTSGYGPWLALDDQVELEITGLGSLVNMIG